MFLLSLIGELHSTYISLASLSYAILQHENIGMSMKDKLEVLFKSKMIAENKREENQTHTRDILKDYRIIKYGRVSNSIGSDQRVYYRSPGH